MIYNILYLADVTSPGGGKEAVFSDRLQKNSYENRGNLTNSPEKESVNTADATTEKGDNGKDANQKEENTELMECGVDEEKLTDCKGKDDSSKNEECSIGGGVKSNKNGEKRTNSLSTEPESGTQKSGNGKEPSGKSGEKPDQPSSNKFERCSDKCKKTDTTEKEAHEKVSSHL
jgi:hypothetical protein